MEGGKLQSEKGKGIINVLKACFSLISVQPVIIYVCVHHYSANKINANFMIDAEADPGSVKRGAGNPNSSMPRPKHQKSAIKNKNRPKKGGPRPIRPPPPPHWIRHCDGLYKAELDATNLKYIIKIHFKNHVFRNISFMQANSVN